MSHPHDGYDSETGVDYGPEGPYYFAWSGDQSNSIMSYIDLNWDFSQFDRVNMNRYLAAAFAGKAAYDQVRKGARQAGVAVVGSTKGWEVDRSSGSAPATGAVADGAADDAARHHRHRMRR